MENPNGLAAEYQKDYGTASQQLDITAEVNNPEANGICTICGLHFNEGEAQLGQLMN